MSNLAKVIVLAEDEQHQRLICQYLYRLPAHVAGGREFQQHDIRTLIAPGGRGSAEQWVRTKYPAEVKEYRRRSARQWLALIVAIDADAGPVDQRHRQLRQALQDAGLEIRGNDEAIVHLIPKRNVETWILCLNGEQVNEVIDYSRKEGVYKLIATSAATLFQWSRPNAAVPTHCVPSLEAAIPEMRRLEEG